MDRTIIHLPSQLTRREFIAVSAATAATLNNHNALWKAPIGCFNRPWMPWSFDQALDAIRQAGFDRMGILGDHAGEPFTTADATQPYLDDLRRRIERRKLKLVSTWMRNRHDVPLDDAKRAAAMQIDNSKRLGAEFILAIGPDAPEQFEHFYTLMRFSAELAESKKLRLVFKPHGGVAAAAAEIQSCLERVAHPNFRLWYDAGNVIHYTGKNPVLEMEPLVKSISGLCAKDCAARGGDVMLQFGEGAVDFRALLQRLKQTKLDGPLMVECCAGKSLDAVTQNARRNREYLQRMVETMR